MTNQETFQSGLHWYVGVFRASAAFRLKQDAEFICNFRDDPYGDYRVTVRTRYRPLNNEVPEPIPRELWVEVCGPESDLDRFMASAHDKANTLVSVMTFALNAATEHLQIDLALDACDHHQEHDFFQNCLPDETGLPRRARWLEAEEVGPLIEALLAHPDRDRLLRAVAQYEAALLYWHPGGELMAMAHLYMAMEALTPLAKRRSIGEFGSLEALAEAWGVEPRSCSECGHEYGLSGQVDAEVRRRVLFQEQDEVYQGAKRASDGFEHGFMPMATVREGAIRHRDALSVLVRRATFDLIGVDPAAVAALLTETRDHPVAAISAQRYWRTTLVGATADLAAPTENYPRFRIFESFDDAGTREDGSVEVSPRYTIQLVAGEGVVAQGGQWQTFLPGPPEAPAGSEDS
jgi:hypothetical protein